MLASASDAQLSGTRVWGFAAPWDARSDSSIRAHGHQLDVIVSGWIGLDSASGMAILPSPYPDTVRVRGANGAAGAAGAAVRRMAIVTSWHGERFHPATIRMLARDGAKLAQTAGAIARHAQSMRYGGLVLDFEDLTPADVDALLRVIRAVADSARARGVKTIAVAVPALDTAAYPARTLATVADFVIPMLYDEHWSGSAPGAVSSPAFVRRALAMRVAEVGASRVVAGLPVYGYRWITGHPTEAMSTTAARALARRVGATITRDPASGSMRVTGNGWDMWVTDAAALRALVSEVRALGVGRVALWRLGREDPDIWK